MSVELTGEQLKTLESQLKRYFPLSLQVYGYVRLLNRTDGVRAEPITILVDKWPDFGVIVCKPVCEQMGDLFKDIVFFVIDEAVLEETIRNPSVIDWSRYLCLGINPRHIDVIKAVASEKGLSGLKRSQCHVMMLEDVSKLPSIDSSGVSLSSLDESHVGLVNQTWKFAENDASVRMIRNMLVSYPSCCVLDADAKPVAWILTYMSCAMGMLYTLPEHRGKGYAKILVGAIAKKLCGQGLPVYCLIEEENLISYRLFKNLGFTEDPALRMMWISFNEL